ncbi:MAG: ribosomal L7Ae/L30e/S12e/Gadd45 family protein [Clostridia bacterium]|nr:ribosomal L7Ae/L30e/S12e/Gadd45 family protein [Clostridia bacterium]
MNRIAGILGLAYRAGALACGTNQVVESVRNGKAKLVLRAKDVSPNTEKELKDKTSFRKVPLEILSCGTEELGAWFGRPPTAAVAILKEDFVTAYRKASASEGRPGPEEPVGPHEEE